MDSIVARVCLGLACAGVFAAGARAQQLPTVSYRAVRVNARCLGGANAGQECTQFCDCESNFCTGGIRPADPANITASPGDVITVEAFISEWSPTLNNPERLRSFQISMNTLELDSANPESTGARGHLELFTGTNAPGHNFPAAGRCCDAKRCEGGPLAGNACSTNSDCPGSPIPSQACQPTSDCSELDPGTCGGGRCDAFSSRPLVAGVFVDRRSNRLFPDDRELNRVDYVFKGLGSELLALDLTSPDRVIRLGSVLQDPSEACTYILNNPGGCVRTQPQYVMTYILVASQDACGTFTINMPNDPANQLLDSSSPESLPIPRFNPTDPNNALCDFDFECDLVAGEGCVLHGCPNGTCVDNLCQGGKRPGQVCSGFDPCPGGTCVTGTCAGGPNDLLPCSAGVCTAPAPLNREALTIDLGPCGCTKIISATPGNCTIDARQPDVPGGTDAQVLRTVDLRFDCPDASGVVNDIQSRESPMGRFELPPVIESVVPVAEDPSVLRVTMLNPMTLGRWTCLRLQQIPLGPGSPGENEVCFGVQPGDTDSSRTTDASDATALIDCIRNPGSCPLGECDIDRTGTCGPGDLLRLIDLFNVTGTGLYDVWLDTFMEIDANTGGNLCPTRLGACCSDTRECLDTTTQARCSVGFSGAWHDGESCPMFTCPGPRPSNEQSGAVRRARRR
ncbi:MAG: hypothetical protein ACE5EX_04100 [Phycisphaerae bacterium]